MVVSFSFIGSKFEKNELNMLDAIEFLRHPCKPQNYKERENSLIATSSPMHKRTIWQRKLAVCW